MTSQRVADHAEWLHKAYNEYDAVIKQLRFVVNKAGAQAIPAGMTPELVAMSIIWTLAKSLELGHAENIAILCDRIADRDGDDPLAKMVEHAMEWKHFRDAVSDTLTALDQLSRLLGTFIDELTEWIDVRSKYPDYMDMVNAAREAVAQPMYRGVIRAYHSFPVMYQLVLVDNM